MEITLSTMQVDNQKDDNGITKVGERELIVVDNKTGEKLTGHSGFLWGGKGLLLKSNDEPLLTKEHLKGDPDDACYLVLVVRCDKAIDL